MTETQSPANPNASPEVQVAQPPAPIPEPSPPRPWVRFWARTFDLYLASIVLAVVGYLVVPDVIEATNDRLFGALAIFLWIFMEAGLLATIGTTPGKWLLRTKLVPGSGLPMGFQTALSRSFKVWFRGNGMGIPLASFIANLVAINRLTENGVTSWDRDEGIVVVHGRIGIARALFITLCFAGILALVVYGIMAEA